MRTAYLISMSNKNRQVKQKKKPDSFQPRQQLINNNWYWHVYNTRSICSHFITICICVCVFVLCGNRKRVAQTEEKTWWSEKQTTPTATRIIKNRKYLLLFEALRREKKTWQSIAIHEITTRPFTWIDDKINYLSVDSPFQTTLVNIFEKPLYQVIQHSSVRLKSDRSSFIAVCQSYVRVDTADTK